MREFGGAILPEGYDDPKVEKALRDAGLEILGRYNPKEDYNEAVGSVLRNLIKDKDRFNTKYLYGILAGLFGLGGIVAGANSQNDKRLDV